MAFQDDLSGHGIEDDLDTVWQRHGKHEEQNSYPHNKDLTKGSSQEEGREARSRRKPYRINTRCLYGCRDSRKGKS